MNNEIFLKVKFKTSVKSPKGPNCLLCPEVEGGGYIFLAALILGGQFWKCTKCEGGGRNIMIQGWPFM